jgi:energy-coupling factor transporter transmembrane protein EcfT
MNKAFKELCTPARIYFAIAVIASIVALFNGIGVFAVAIKLLFAFVWTFILGWLCKKGFTSISWFLVLLPYIIIVLAMAGIYRVTKEQKELMQAIQLQDAYGQDSVVEGLTRNTNRAYIPSAQCKKYYKDNYNCKKKN